MNIAKIQTELLKDALNGKASKWLMELDESDIILSTKYQMYVIEAEHFILDVNKLVGAGVKTMTSGKNILDGYKNAKPLTKTPIKRVMGNLTCIELKLGEELIYIDEALLKNYDKSIEFEGTSGKSVVYIYEGELLVGLVLPVRV